METNEIQSLLLQAIYHIRRVHMNTRSWTLNVSDEQAITILQRAMLAVMYGMPMEQQQ